VTHKADPEFQKYWQDYASIDYDEMVAASEAWDYQQARIEELEVENTKLCETGDAILRATILNDGDPLKAAAEMAALINARRDKVEEAKR